jgi:RNA polymerase sigma-70 factor (ECF subfamily)
MTSGPSPEPEKLLQIARTGDVAALGQLFELYRNYLTLLARLELGRRLRGKVDDADLIQETFLEAHRHFHRFRGRTESEVITWLRRILATTLAHLVRRYCGTGRRQVRLERELELQLDESSHLLDRGLIADGSSPSERASRREQAVLLADAIQRLPEAYREVIILSHLEGLSFPEVARQMGRTLDSVKNLWARGLARLRRLMGGES